LNDLLRVDFNGLMRCIGSSIMTTTPNSQPGFLRLLWSSFRYPFCGNGPIVIVSGAVVFAIAGMVAAYASIFGLIMGIGIAGYLAAFAKDVVNTSATGQEVPPAWVDFSDWAEDLVAPALQFLLVAAVAVGPMIVLQWKSPFPGHEQTVALASAGVWGCLTFPILFLAVAMMDSALAVLNPIPLVRAVVLTLPTYLPTCGLLAFLSGLGYGLSMLLALAGHIPLLSDVLGQLCVLYLIAVFMRSLGLFYRFNQERLQW
jgi:hypothetical protein